MILKLPISFYDSFNRVLPQVIGVSGIITETKASNKYFSRVTTDKGKAEITAVYKSNMVQLDISGEGADFISKLKRDFQNGSINTKPLRQSNY